MDIPIVVTLGDVVIYVFADDACGVRVHQNGTRAVRHEVVELVLRIPFLLVRCMMGLHRLYLLVQPRQRQVHTQYGHRTPALVADGQQIRHQWRPCTVVVEERLGPVAFFARNGILKPLVLHIVVPLVDGVLRLDDGRAVAPCGVGRKQASLLGVVVLDEVDATAAHVWVQFHHPVDDVMHAVGIAQVVLYERRRIDGRHVEVGCDAPHLLLLTLQYTVADARDAQGHDAIGYPEQ